MKKTLVAFLIALPISTFASQASFYPDGFESKIKSGILAGPNLKTSLISIVSHNHHALGYDRARVEMFGKIDLKKDSRGPYLKDVYCHQEFSGKSVGPNKIPDNTIVNCEHTWPQSKFSPKADERTQKSDLHHLYVTGARVNSARGNNPFGEVHGKAPTTGCEISSIGKVNDKNSNASILVFEPPAEHRGNVARSIFYFSVRYNINIDPMQEETLRRWNKDDPVDEEEMHRNDLIEQAQGNRNVFVDFPETVDQIKDF